LVWYLDGVGVERPPFYRCTLKCSVTLLNFLSLSSWSNILVSQLLAGLSEPTSGSICIQKYDDSGNLNGMSEMLTSQRVGIVFQFPERFELLLSWRLCKMDRIAYKLWCLKI
jgi:ABC-type ATPase involved in cell division